MVTQACISVISTAVERIKEVISKDNDEDSLRLLKVRIRYQSVPLEL